MKREPKDGRSEGFLVYTPVQRKWNVTEGILSVVWITHKLGVCIPSECDWVIGLTRTIMWITEGFMTSFSIWTLFTYLLESVEYGKKDVVYEKEK